MLVKDLMKRVYTIDKDITLKEAAKIMSDKGYGCLVFVSGDKIRGIITERDLLKNFESGGVVSDVMTKKVITIGGENNIVDALGIMRKSNIKKLPVVDGKNKLIGIITLTDLAKISDDAGEGFFFD